MSGSGLCERCESEPGKPHNPVEGDCVLPHSHNRQTHPPAARTGWCCKGCVARHGEWAREIGKLYVLLSPNTDDMPNQSTGEYQKPRKAPASPALLNLTAWALLHPETINPSASDKYDGFRSGYLTGLPDVPAVLAGWAQEIYDLAESGAPAPTTVSGAVAVILAHPDTLAYSEDVDTYDAELKWLRNTLRKATGAVHARPVGRCPSLDGWGKECAGPLWPDESGRMAVQCGKCQRRYDERFLSHLGGMMTA